MLARFPPVWRRASDGRSLLALLWPESGQRIRRCRAPLRRGRGHRSGHTPAAALRTGSGDVIAPNAAVPDTVDAGLPGDSATAGEAAVPARLSRPDSVRALYLNAWAAGSRSRMADLIRIAETTEINALVIDIKESDSYLTHAATSIALANAKGIYPKVRLLGLASAADRPR